MREEQEWWHAILSAYNGYEKGFLPEGGGLSTQSSLFMPTMSLMSLAIKEEDELAKLIQAENAPPQTKSNGKTSVFNKDNGYRPITTP